MLVNVSRKQVNLPPLKERTISAVVRKALANCPDKIALQTPELSYTYRTLVDESLSLAGSVMDRGVERQKPVLIMFDNHDDFVKLWLGLALTGRIEAPINTAYQGSILEHVVRITNTDIIFIEGHYLERLADLPTALELLKTVIVRGEVPDVQLPKHIELLKFENLALRRVEPDDIKPWDIMAIMYTSGTSGPSKGVLVPNAHAYGYSSPTLQNEVTEQDTGLVFLPLFHLTAQLGGIYKSIIAQATVVLLPKFSATTFWSSARRFDCTHTMMLGTVAQFLLNQPAHSDDATQPLKKIGMAPVIADLEAFKQRFGVEGVFTGYGSTELSTVATAPVGEAVPGQAGYLRSDFEVRIVDEDDIDVPDGQIGELIVRPTEPWTIMTGYINMPEATAKAWRNLWFHTSDMVRIADNGQLVFCDRNNDALRRRGENISSFEVEREIDKHPDIIESAVVKAPSNHADDEIKACVVLRPGADLTHAALHTYASTRLPGFMVPRYIEIFKELPKTPTEKIQKAELRKTAISPSTWDSLTGKMIES